MMMISSLLNAERSKPVPELEQEEEVTVIQVILRGALGSGSGTWNPKFGVWMLHGVMD